MLRFLPNADNTNSNNRTNQTSNTGANSNTSGTRYGTTRPYTPPQSLLPGH